MQRLNFAIKLVEACGPSLGKVQAYLDKLHEKCTGLECVELQRLNDSQRPCRECCESKAVIFIEINLLDRVCL